MIFKNSEIEPLMGFLYEMKLKSKASRMRTRFISKLNQHVSEYITPEKESLIDQYAEKDENGEAILAENKKGIKLIEDKIPEFYEEFKILMDEDFVLDEIDSNREMILSVAESVLNYDIELSGQIAILYDQWCEKMEEAIEHFETQDKQG